MTEAEIGLMCLQVKNLKNSLRITGGPERRERAGNTSSLTASCGHLDLGLLASSTERGYISVV